MTRISTVFLILSVLLYFSLLFANNNPFSPQCPKIFVEAFSLSSKAGREEPPPGIEVAPTSFTNVPGARYCVRWLNFTQNRLEQAVTVESFHDCGKSDKGANLAEIASKNPDRMDLILYQFTKDPAPLFGMMGYQFIGQTAFGTAASELLPPEQTLPNSFSNQLPKPNFQMWIAIDRIFEYTFDMAGSSTGGIVGSGGGEPPVQTDIPKQAPAPSPPTLRILQDFALDQLPSGNFASRIQEYEGEGRQYRSAFVDLQVPLNTAPLTPENAMQPDITTPSTEIPLPLAQTLHLRAVISESETRGRTPLLSGGAQGGRDAFAFRTTPTSISLQMSLHGLRRGVIQGTGDLGGGTELQPETQSAWAVSARVMISDNYKLNTNPQKEPTAPYTTADGDSYPLPYDILPDYYMYNVSEGGMFVLGNPETGAPNTPLGFLTVPRFAYGNDGSRILVGGIANNVPTGEHSVVGGLSTQMTRVLLLPTQKQESERIGENRDATGITTLQFAPFFIGAVEATRECNCANNVQQHWDSTDELVNQ